MVSKAQPVAKIATYFNIDGNLSKWERFGCGHINDTFLLEFTDSKNTISKYILQSVNTNVFKNIYAVMDNIIQVTEHIQKKISDHREVMGIIPTNEGKSYYTDDQGNCWRIYDYIDNTICLQLPENLDDFYECAVGFGRFQRYLADFPADKLSETIPDFHNTPKRYEAFLQSVENDCLGRVSEVKPEIEAFKSYQNFYSLLIEKNKNGELPLRVSHNDTKCNNVLLDKNTRKALCVIDLDTIMPGFSVNDFGDAIRFGASSADEDEPDISKVNFEINKFKIYTKGYLNGCGGLLSPSEIMLMPEGAKMMTLECGMRFLTDYLNGDTYFKISRPKQNLDRCRTHLKLVSDMEKNWKQMKSCVEEYI